MFRWITKLINATPSEELDGIQLDLSQPYWELDGKINFLQLLIALEDLLPEGSILYFEGGSRDKRLLEFFNTHAIPEQTHIAVGTIWPKPVYFHVPATPKILKELANLSVQFAEFELAWHFHVYHDGRVLLQWHDAFTIPMLVSADIPEDRVKNFSLVLSMSMTK